VPEAEYRLLFVLSDFEFSERPADLDPPIGVLAGQNVRYLGAAQGRVNKSTSERFHAGLGGQVVSLRNLDAVPGLLMDAIENA